MGGFDEEFPSLKGRGHVQTRYPKDHPNECFDLNYYFETVIVEYCVDKQILREKLKFIEDDLPDGIMDYLEEELRL